MLDHDLTKIDFTALKELDAETDALCKTLADSRRRFVLGCLEKHATPMALSDVADELATWEAGMPLTEIPAGTVNSLYLSLYHNHIPQMADTGVVKYNQERDAVSLTEMGRELTSLVGRPMRDA